MSDDEAPRGGPMNEELVFAIKNMRLMKSFVGTELLECGAVESHTVDGNERVKRVNMTLILRIMASDNKARLKKWDRVLKSRANYDNIGTKEAEGGQMRHWVSLTEMCHLIVEVPGRAARIVQHGLAQFAAGASTGRH